jgi:lyso-ornithine lipid O-acyltransferase
VLDGVFVSKSDVRSWPLIGTLTCLAGTIFVDRRNRKAATRTIAEMREALASGLPVTFWPEGTSSDGKQVLPFRAGLFEAPISAGEPLWPSFIAYRIRGQSAGVSEHICYYGDMTFVPHLVRFLRLEDVSAELRFDERPILVGSRVAAARLCQSAVARLSDLATP